MLVDDMFEPDRQLRFQLGLIYNARKVLSGQEPLRVETQQSESVGIGEVDTVLPTVLIYQDVVQRALADGPAAFEHYDG